MTGDPLADVRPHYMCSTGHWVTSSLIHEEGAPCPAMYERPDSTPPVPCSGTLGDPLLYLWEIAAVLDAEVAKWTDVLRGLEYGRKARALQEREVARRAIDNLRVALLGADDEVPS